MRGMMAMATATQSDLSSFLEFLTGGDGADRMPNMHITSTKLLIYTGEYHSQIPSSSEKTV